MRHLLVATFLSGAVFALTAGTTVPASSQTLVTSSATDAPQGGLVPIENWKVMLVTARKVAKLGEISEISDAFTYEGRIYAHTTLTSLPGAYGGPQFFEVKWFNGDNAVSVQKAEYAVNKSPFYLASSTSGTALGAGKCRVEVYAGGKLIASKSFVITER